MHRRGVEQFVQDAARAGVDGLLALDLPPEESENYEQRMREAGLCNIYLVAPTTPEDRIARIVKRASGFVYYISREGVTCMQDKVAADLGQKVALIRAHTDLPVAVGFGISNPDQARLVAQHADPAADRSRLRHLPARARGPDRPVGRRGGGGQRRGGPHRAAGSKPGPGARGDGLCEIPGDRA
jgi:tryptophan synthase alpha chain